MANNKLLQQMLESLVNDDQAKAEELFHEYVVQQSREIYESLIDSEIAEEEEKDEEEEVEEASEKDEDEEDKVEENFEAFGDEEDGPDMMGGDPTDDLEGELDGEEGEGEQSEEELMQDLSSIIDELQAKFDALTGSEEEQGEFGDEMGDEEGPEKEGFELATVREYVEKVPAGHGAEKKGQAEKADNTKSTIDNMKNDMGGTTANILSGRNGADAGEAGAGGGALKGTGLEKGKVTDNPDAKGNVNVPGGNAGKTGFKTKEPGHGAEKAGSKESADNKQSLFRGRR